MTLQFTADLSSRSLIRLTETETRRFYPIGPPPEDFIALNVDDSVREVGSLAGCGGVLRNSHGDFVLGFSQKLHSCSVLEAEVWVIFHGLQIAWGKGWRKTIVQSDS